ncbi:DUF1275 domain-containing protein [Actinoallomurus sp. NBC_01490]|uniref:YoaK family protein n=1 Tax=Actinoallomurus sp. NBC_01490 TaxID=2903557 RepID=UPI002E3332E5|nr:YoaK family protein [Actinoallomurus sp. NBC_01490]
MDQETSRETMASLQLGVLLAFAGGFQDAYSFIGLGGVFANAQTGNVVLLGVDAGRQHWAEALRHVPPLLAFILGVAVAETLSRPRVAAVLRWPARFALVLEIIVLGVVGALPGGVSYSLIVVMIAFTASVQVTTFRTLIVWPYNTAMVTGNLRTAAQAAYQAVADRDPEARRKSRSFATVIVSFMAGAIAGGLLTLELGRHAIWISAGVLLGALGLFVVDEHRGVIRDRLRGGRRDRDAE